MSRKVFMAQGGIEAKGGGVTRVLFNRSRILSERGYDVSLLTFDFTNNFPEEAMREARAAGRLADDVDIINVHDYYRKKNTIDPSNIDYLFYQKSSNLFEEGYHVQMNEFTTKNYARYFKNGVYVMFKRWKKNGSLSHINYFNESRSRYLTVDFHEEGFVYRKKYYEPTLDKVKQELLYTPDGFCFLNKWYDVETGNVINIYLFERNTKEAKIFKSNREFHAYWLNELCSSFDQKPIIICDGIGSIPKVMDMDPNVAHRIYPLHNNHFDKPYTWGSPIKEDYLVVLENLQNLDVLVVLTEEQKKDIIEQFGDYGNIEVIPNSTALTNLDHNVVKDPLKVTMFARYQWQKNIDEAIHAFDLVRKVYPDAKLEIYGQGKLEEQHQETIKKLNIEDNVKLMGYSMDVAKSMASSIVTLLTSRYEGFGLAIVESMANGTPVISYDVKYGPAQIIDDSINGFLVKVGDRKQLANRIIELLSNTDKAIEMGKRAREKVATEFSEERIGDKWIDLFNRMD